MYNNIDDNITVTERGWAGHFAYGNFCNYHRNTLISYNEKKIVVSTVGKFRPFSLRRCLHTEKGFEPLDERVDGGEQHYQTEIAYAKFINGYWEYPLSDGIYDDDAFKYGIYDDVLLEYQDKVSRIDPSFDDSDGFADEYHDKCVQIVIDLLKENKL